MKKTNPMKKTILALALAAGLTSFAGSAKADIVYNSNPNFSIGECLFQYNILPHYYNAGFTLFQHNWVDYGEDGTDPSYSNLSTFNSDLILATLGQTISSSTSFGGGLDLDNGEYYIGLSLSDIDNNRQTYYGWLKATVSGANEFYGRSVSFTLNQFAYDNTGASIAVGQTTAAVPEPSTYALFGLGAIGMLMVLRKKKTA
jgi:hypothetical protein